jgi:DNA-binding FadR family transcriptional regulator
MRRTPNKRTLSAVQARATPGVRKADVVARSLLDRIVHKAFAVGDVLPTEAAIAREFAVNRSVVREAIKLLEVHRLVRPVRRRGTVVLDPLASTSPEVVHAMLRGARGTIDLPFFESLLEIRAVLDAQICSLAAGRRTKADLEALAAALESLRVATDRQQYTDATAQWGLALARATHNPVCEMLSHWNRQVVRELGPVFAAIQPLGGAHLEGLGIMLECIRAKDAERARTMVAAYHAWATPRLLAAASLANGTPLDRVRKELR